MTECAGVVITRADGRTLAVRSARLGRWGFPFGKCDPGEAHGDAAVREGREETGVLVTRMVEVYRAPDEDGRGAAVAFLALAWRGEPRPSAEGDVAWVEEALLTAEGSGRFPAYNRAVFAALRSWDDARRAAQGGRREARAAREARQRGAAPPATPNRRRTPPNAPWNAALAAPARERSLPRGYRRAMARWARKPSRRAQLSIERARRAMTPARERQRALKISESVCRQVSKEERRMEKRKTAPAAPTQDDGLLGACAPFTPPLSPECAP